jgi:hypothetical protein
MGFLPIPRGSNLLGKKRRILYLSGFRKQGCYFLKTMTPMTEVSMVELSVVFNE